MTTEMNKPQAIDYLKCRKPLNNLGISDQEIITALNQLNITKKDLCDELHVKIHGNEPKHYQAYEFLKTGIGHFKEYNGEYVKEYMAKADIYLVPARYQGLKHDKIIHRILSNRFGWFNTFLKDKNYQESETGKYFDILGRLDVNKLPEEYLNLSVAELIAMKKGPLVTKKESAWSLYEMYDENYEVYLTTEYGSLYVPIKALLDGDSSIIKRRMKSYADSYHDPKKLSGYALNHRGRSKQEYAKDKLDDYNKMIAPLKSKEAKLLFKHLIK